MVNTFNNLNELKDLIAAGKTNQEIISERISFLSSDDYIKNLQIKKDGNGAILFYNGFYNKNMTDVLDSEDARTFNEDPDKYGTKYTIKGEDFYDDILNIIRNTIDINSGGLLNIIYDYVVNYFEKVDEKTTDFYKKYSEFKYTFQKTNLKFFEQNYNENNINNYNILLDMQKNSVEAAKEKMNKKILDYRNEINGLLASYMISGYDGDFLEFCEANYCYLKAQNSFTLDMVENNLEYLNLYKKRVLTLDKTTVDKKEFDICSLKGLGIGACLERSLLSQNLLTFFGYESYKLNGFANDINNPHAFNVISTSTEPKKFYIFDTAMKCKSKLVSANSIDDIINMKDIVLVNKKNDKVKYTTSLALNKEYDENASQIHR